MWCLILNLIDAPNSTNSGVFHNLVMLRKLLTMLQCYPRYLYTYADKTTTEHHCLQLALVWMVKITAIKSCIGFWIIIKCIQVKVSVLV